MKRMIVGVVLLALVAIVVGLGRARKAATAQASQTSTREVPTFQVDPSWPKKLPNNWVWGPVSGVTVDAQAVGHHAPARNSETRG